MSEGGYKIRNQQGLTNNIMIDQRLNYIHNNPLEAGIVKNAVDYLYSSAKDYSGEQGLIKIELL